MLSLRSPCVGMSNFSERGLCFRMEPTHKGGRTVGRCLARRERSDKVVCYTAEGGMSRLCLRLRGTKFSIKECRTKVKARTEGRDRRSFVCSEARVVVTAGTFKVKVSGSGIHFMLRCGVPRDVRGCCRRTNETKQSKRPTRYVLFCSPRSVVVGRLLLSDGRRVKRCARRRLQIVQRRSILQLHGVDGCYAADVYLEGCVLGCFKRRARRRYKGYSGYLRRFIRLSIKRVTTSIVRYIHRSERECNVAVVLSALTKTGATGVEDTKVGRLSICKERDGYSRRELGSMICALLRRKCLRRDTSHCTVLGLARRSRKLLRSERLGLHYGGSRLARGGGSKDKGGTSREGNRVFKGLASGDQRLFRRLHSVHCSLTGGGKVPPCVITSSHALRRVYMLIPFGGRRLLRMRNVKLGGCRRCKRIFLSGVRRIATNSGGNCNVSRSTSKASTIRGRGPLSVKPFKDMRGWRRGEDGEGG